MPIAEGLETASDLPYTLSYAVLYRERIDSFNELPKDKRPPRDLWDKPYKLTEFLESIWDTDGAQKKPSTQFYEYDSEDVE